LVKKAGRIRPAFSVDLIPASKVVLIQMEIEYFEDIKLNQKKFLGEYLADKDEMIEYARKWDPQPFHIDEEAAKTYPYGGITASSGYTLAIITLLRATNEQPRGAILGMLEYEKVKILKPVYPGDHLTVTSEPIEMRESGSNPDRGIVKALVETRNQHDEVVLSYIIVAMIAKRPV